MATKVDPKNGTTDQNADMKIPAVPLAWTEQQQDNQETPRPTHGVFTDLDKDSMKKQVRDAILKEVPYSVFDFYKEDVVDANGAVKPSWQWIAKHPVFENTTLAVIALNAVYIAIDTDWNKSEPLTPTGTNSLTDSPVFFQFMEHAFCTYFTGEWIIRFMSFKIKRNGLRDGWFVFDSALVFMMVMETWVLLIVMAAAGGGGSPLGKTGFLRLFRLLRLSRLMRMLRSLPELMILVKGMVTAMKSVSYVMALLTLIIYVFAIAFTQLAVGTPSIGEIFFSNVALSMYSLLVYATFGDNLSYFLDYLRYEYWPLCVLAFVFIPLAAMTVMNMLIGVLCEVVTIVADTERETILTENVKEKLGAIVKELDSNKDNHISYTEFAKIMEKPEALAALEEVDVSAVGIVDFAELFFDMQEDGSSTKLSFEAFMECVLDLRATNTATVKDVLDLWKKVKTTTTKEAGIVKQNLERLSSKVEENLSTMQARTDKVESLIGELAKEVATACSRYAK